MGDLVAGGPSAAVTYPAVPTQTLTPINATELQSLSFQPYAHGKKRFEAISARSTAADCRLGHRPADYAATTWTTCSLRTWPAPAGSTFASSFPLMKHVSPYATTPTLNYQTFPPGRRGRQRIPGRTRCLADSPPPNQDCGFLVLTVLSTTTSRTDGRIAVGLAMRLNVVPVSSRRPAYFHKRHIHCTL